MVQHLLVCTIMYFRSTGEISAVAFYRRRYVMNGHHKQSPSISSLTSQMALLEGGK